MSGTEIFLWCALMVLLLVYARIKHRQTLQHLREPYEPADWTGKAIDVTALEPKLEGVRHDYLAARQPDRGLCFHRALVELARHAVAGLAYFQEREPEEHAQVHTR